MDVQPRPTSCRSGIEPGTPTLGAAWANEVIPAVPTESGSGLEHLGADARDGGDLGSPVARGGTTQGSLSDPTVNPHGRA
jgi:hypothetical protein